MISYEEALGRLLAGLHANPPEDVELARLVEPGSSARPRFAARSLSAPVSLPPFDNSAVDGYAVRAVDTQSADPVLTVSGSIPAGPTPPSSGNPGSAPVLLPPGTATRIFTGAPIPAGADAVLMQEDCELDPEGRLLVLDPVKPWENIRFAGDDVKAGTVILAVGDELTPQRIALLQACGVQTVNLTTAPTVALIASGSELRPAGAPLPPGCIYESNLGALTRLVESAGAHVVSARVIPDDPAATHAALDEASRLAQVVLTVGGASVGDHDLFKSAALELGFGIDFWRIAMKPGKPFFAGRRDSTYLLGLPGNPVSAFATAVLLVLPALRQLAGAESPAPATRPGILAEPISNPGSRRHFVRARIDDNAAVRPTGVQASHILSSLAAANSLVDIPADTALEPGALVRVITW